MVSDVDAVQDLVIRVCCRPPRPARSRCSRSSARPPISPAAALVLAAGLVVAGVALPAVAAGLTRRTADRVAPLRGALAGDAVDLTEGAAELAAFGATGSALSRAEGHTRELARLERRLAAVGWAVDGLGVLVSGATAAAVVVVALRADVDGVLVGVLAVGTLAAVEVALSLIGAARQRTAIRGGLRRVAALLDPAPPGNGHASTRTCHAGDANTGLADAHRRHPQPPRRDPQPPRRDPPTSRERHDHPERGDRAAAPPQAAPPPRRPRAQRARPTGRARRTTYPASRTSVSTTGPAPRPPSTASTCACRPATGSRSSAPAAPARPPSSPP